MVELPRSLFFPPAEMADNDGLLAVGGHLSVQWLLDAYQHGIFPWPFLDVEPLLWWSPDPRAIFEFESIAISRRFRRTLRQGPFAITCDRNFSAVIRGCADGDRLDNTWLTPEMIEAYEQMHQLGHAHSVEAWHEGKLVGGVYGVSVGGVFAAESMFYRRRDASKVALAHLLSHLRQRGYSLVDIQQLTPHTASLGAIEIPRREYLARLAYAVSQPITFGKTLESESAWNKNRAE